MPITRNPKRINQASAKQSTKRLKQIAAAIEKKEFVQLVLPVETNIIIFELHNSISASELVAKLKNYSILGYAISPNRVRLVVHLDISNEMVAKTIEAFNQL